MIKDKKQRKKNKNIAIIRKANNLIEARYKFDIWETRFFLMLLSKIEKDEKDIRSYRIWYKDIIYTFGLKSNHNAYDLLRAAVRRLMERTLVVNSEDENGVIREHRYSIVTYANMLVHVPSHIDRSTQEYIDVSISANAKHLLLQLQKCFTSYDLNNVTSLGVYSIRIYELLKQYESIGSRVLGVDYLKNMFQIMDEYPRFSNFYQKIIKTALKEINEFTDLLVSEPTKIKNGREVSALAFSFVKRQINASGRQSQDEPLPEKNNLPEDKAFLNEIPEISIPESQQNVVNELYLEFEKVVVKGFGVTPSVFLSLLPACSREQVAQAVRVTRRAKAGGQIKSNVSGFFVQALKGGYTDAKEAQERKKQTQLLFAPETAPIAPDLEKRVNDRIRELTTEKPDLPNLAIERMKTDTRYQQRIAQKIIQLGRSLVVEDFRQDKFLRNGVKATIIEMERAQFADIIF
jgi:plasmid replication initiation protein